MKKKILHIIDSMGLGGAQTVVKGIFEGRRENNNVFLYALRKRDINIKINHKNIFCNNSKNKFSFPILKLKKFIEKNNIEILHCHLAKSQIIGYILKKMFFSDIKLIFHEHGEIFEDGKIYPFLMNLFRKKVDLYLAVSKATKNEILKKTNFEENKIKVLYNFVDLNRFKKIENFDKKRERKKYGLKEEDFVVGFASRLYEGKGWKELIFSAKELIEEGYKLKFVIGGDGEDKDKIERFIKENSLEKNIKLIGYVGDMVSFYNMIDLFVFPSHREAMPMTILEVNANGIPIIASNIDGVNEILKHNKNALLFKVRNYQDLKMKILEIFNHKELQKKLIKGGLENVEKFSLEKYLVDLNKIYEEL